METNPETLMTEKLHVTKNLVFDCINLLLQELKKDKLLQIVCVNILTDSFFIDFNMLIK